MEHPNLHGFVWSIWQSDSEKYKTKSNNGTNYLHSVVIHILAQQNVPIRRIELQVWIYEWTPY